jgi:subtilase family serine protease
MKEFNSSRRSFTPVRSLLMIPLTAVATALATLAAHAAPVALRDLGVVPPSTSVSAVVWLKGSNEANFDTPAAALGDSASSTYHRWMQDDDIAAYAPSKQDIATARASFAALGLTVDKVFDGGSMVRVSGTAAQMQAAFGTTLHTVQTAAGRTLLKATVPPSYRGTHAELVGGVSGLGGAVTRPFVARQTNLVTGVPVPQLVPQAGTDPLARFTTKCFGTDYTETMAGFGGIGGVEAGGVLSTAVGPTYSDPTTTTGRLVCGYTARQLVAHYGIDEAHALGLGLKGKGQTIVIVDACGSPTALADLNIFSAAMGLPKMTSDTFKVAYSDGVPSDSDADWALETTLDIEWAHAFAPEAKIVWVVVPSSDNAELAYGIVVRGGSPPRQRRLEQLGPA